MPPRKDYSSPGLNRVWLRDSAGLPGFAEDRLGHGRPQLINDDRQAAARRPSE